MPGVGTVSQLCPYALAGVAAAGSTVPSHLVAETLGGPAPELPLVRVCAQSVLPALETRLDLRGEKVCLYCELLAQHRW